MHTLCDDWLNENEAAPPPAHLMIRRHGAGPEGARCRTCAHLYGKQYAKRYYKCELAGHRGPNTDWRVNWPACDLYEPLPEGETATVYDGR